MYIESVNIERFGGITSLAFGLGPGVNIIEGSNEAGKTTVASFIRYMLYGFSDKSEREFYCGTMGVKGTIDISDGDTRVRIEREYGDFGEKVSFIDLTDNSVIGSNGCVPGEMLLGVPVNVYDRTAYVGQQMGASVDGGMKEAIENLLFTADESTNTAKILKHLDEQRIALRHKNGKGGRIYELTEERDALKERLKAASEAHKTIFAKEAALANMRDKIERNALVMDELEVKIRRCDDGMLLRQYRQLDNLRLETEKTQAAIDYAIADMTHDGFFPDREYLANLKLVRGELEMLGEELDRAEELACIEAANDRTSYNFSPAAVLEEMGGEEKVTSKLRQIHRGRTVSGIFGGMFAALFVAAMFFGVLMLMVNPVTGVAVIGAGGAFLIASIILIARSYSVRRGETEILDALGVSSVGEYYEYLPVWRENADRIDSEARNSGSAAELNAANEAYALKQSELDVLAARWGSFEPDEIIADVEASLDELDGLYAAHERAMTKYSGAKQALGSLTEEELRERLENAPSEEELAALGSANLKRDFEFAKNADKNMHEKLLTLEKELAAAKASAEHPSRIAERINELESEIAGLTFRADALTLAHEKLSQAASCLRGSISPKLSEYAGNYLERLTDGKYATLNVDSDLGMTYADNTGHLAQKLNHMSAGTGDLAYISLRLALIRLLYRNIRPALIFDESFSRLDDDRLACALNVLFTASGDGTQSVVFTSHKRDADIMDNIGEYDYVKL